MSSLIKTTYPLVSSNLTNIKILINMVIVNLSDHYKKSVKGTIKDSERRIKR